VKVLRVNSTLKLARIAPEVGQPTLHLLKMDDALSTSQALTNCQTVKRCFHGNAIVNNSKWGPKKNMSDVGPEIIVKTQKSLGKYVKKPVLSEKLLKKPPFRFLHDVIKAVIKETGFLEGLFAESELESDNVKEKEAKMAFLTKLIDAVSKFTPHL